MSERSYYICQFRLNKKARFVIWFSSGRDGLLLDNSGKIVALGTLSLARAHARKKGITIQPEPVPVYDFDAISSWCSKPLPSQIDCVLFLNAWNMLSDVAASIGDNSIFAVADKGLKKIYEKLFFGNNLPAVTPEGKSYVPEWSAAEADKIARVFRAGLQDLYGSLPA
jgi:hypothetical protein